MGKKQKLIKFENKAVKKLCSPTRNKMTGTAIEHKIRN
jgi:hypothetical protein